MNVRYDATTNPRLPPCLTFRIHVEYARNGLAVAPRPLNEPSALITGILVSIVKHHSWPPGLRKQNVPHRAGPALFRPKRSRRAPRKLSSTIIACA